jgi:hypothetical protein
MKDDIYTYPLTIKVRVDNGWDAVEATQAGKDVATRFVLHGDGKFLLVQAVPDAGEVVLAKATPTVCLAPVIQTPGGRHRGRVAISVASPTTDAAIRYTLDGTDPGPGSQLYGGPVVIEKDATVEFRAACFREGIMPSPVVGATYEVWLDRVPPKLVTADAVAGTSSVALGFSERLDKASAENAARYSIEGLRVGKAQLLGDERTVVLDIGVVPEGQALVVAVQGVTDLSGNAVAQDAPLAVTPAARATDEGLVAHWRFGESANALYVLDGCGASGPGLVNGTPQRADTDKGPAFVFDGKTTITTPNSTYGLTKNNACTVAVWVRFDGALKGQVVAKGKYAVPFAVSGYPNRQAIQAYARMGKDVKKNLPGKIERGTWYHVAIAAGDDTLIMYLDGKAVFEEKFEVRVRCPNEPTFMGKGLSGAVADLRVYNCALSPDEIATLAGK